MKGNDDMELKQDIAQNAVETEMEAPFGELTLVRAVRRKDQRPVVAAATEV